MHLFDVNYYRCWGIVTTFFSNSPKELKVGKCHLTRDMHSKYTLLVRTNVESVLLVVNLRALKMHSNYA